MITGSLSLPSFTFASSPLSESLEQATKDHAKKIKKNIGDLINEQQLVLLAREGCHYLALAVQALKVEFKWLN